MKRPHCFAEMRTPPSGDPYFRALLNKFPSTCSMRPGSTHASKPGSAFTHTSHRLGEIGVVFHDAFDEHAHFDLFAVDREPFCFEAGSIEEIAHHPGEASRGRANAPHRSRFVFRLHSGQPLFEQLRVEQNGADRLAKIVGDDRGPLFPQTLELLQMANVAEDADGALRPVLAHDRGSARQYDGASRRQ